MPDPNVAHLTFTHYGFTRPPAPGVRLDALIELSNGTFLRQDWTSGADQNFCRSGPGQDVTSVLLMASNGALSGAGNFLQPGAKIQASDACVPTGYESSVTNKLQINNAVQQSLQVAQSTVSFKFDVADSNPAIGQFEYNTTGGTVQLSFSGSSGGCTDTASGSFPIAAWQPPNLSGSSDRNAGAGPVDVGQQGLGLASARPSLGLGSADSARPQRLGGDSPAASAPSVAPKQHRASGLSPRTSPRP